MPLSLHWPCYNNSQWPFLSGKLKQQGQRLHRDEPISAHHQRPVAYIKVESFHFITKKKISAQLTGQTNWIAMIPEVLIAEKAFKETFLMYPFTVNITRYWSSTNSLTGIIEVILSPSDKDSS